MLSSIAPQTIVRPAVAPAAPAAAPAPTAAPTAAAQRGRLPDLQALELRVTFDRDAAKGASFLDFRPTQLDTEPWGNQKSFTSFADAQAAATQLSFMRSTAVAVVQGQMDRTWDPEHNKPSFFISPLEAIRSGHVGPKGASGSFGPPTAEFPNTLPLDAKLAGIETRDLSEVRYVMWDEAVQAIVNGSTTLQRGKGDVPWTATLLDKGHGF
jgi:hypothetical protein